MTISIQRLIDDGKCYEMVRELRWPDGVRCPHCDQQNVVKNGHDSTEPCRGKDIVARRVQDASMT